MRQSVFILWLFIFVSAAHSQLFAYEGQQTEENTIEINDTKSEIEVLETLRVVDVKSAYFIIIADEEGKEYAGRMPYEEAERSGILTWPEEGYREVKVAWHKKWGGGLVITETGKFYKAYFKQKDVIDIKIDICLDESKTQDASTQCFLNAAERWKREYMYYYNLALSKTSNDELKDAIIAADIAAKSYARLMDEVYNIAIPDAFTVIPDVKMAMFRSGIARQQLWLLLPLFEIIPFRYQN